MPRLAADPQRLPAETPAVLAASPRSFCPIRVRASEPAGKSYRAASKSEGLARTGSSLTFTHNRGSGKPGYIGAWDVDCLGLLIAGTSAPPGSEGRCSSGPVSRLRLRGQQPSRHARCEEAAKATCQDARKLPVAAVGRSAGELKPPENVKAEVHQSDGVKITWTDAADNEIGFRVDRQIEGGKWTPITYRPPRIQGHAENPQTWVDFVAPSRKALRYRVVAVDADDSDAVAGLPTAAATLNTGAAGRSGAAWPDRRAPRRAPYCPGGSR